MSKCTESLKDSAIALVTFVGTSWMKVLHVRILPVVIAAQIAGFDCIRMLLMAMLSNAHADAWTVCASVAAANATCDWVLQQLQDVI